jgi:hypothetical protein
MNIPFKKFYFYNSILAAAMHACIESIIIISNTLNRDSKTSQSQPMHIVEYLSYPLLCVANALTLIYFKGENISSWWNIDPLVKRSGGKGLGW